MLNQVRNSLFSKSWRSAFVIGGTICCAVLIWEFKQFSDRIAVEAAIIQDLADQLGGPVFVSHTSGPGIWIGTRKYYSISHVDLPHLESDDMDDVAESLNQLSHLVAVFIDRSDLSREDKVSMKRQLRSDILIAENPASIDGWEVIQPRLTP